MDFKTFYYSISDSKKLKYLEELLQSKLKLQQDFKSKLAEIPHTKTIEVGNNQTFAELVAEFKKKFENTFSSIDFSDFDWEDIYIPSGHYVEEWELIDDYFNDQISALFIPVKDLLLDKLIENKIPELLAALYSLYSVSQNFDINEGDYCSADTVRNGFLDGCFEVTTMVFEKIKNVPKLEPNISKVLIMFFDYYFSEQQKDHYIEKQLESLLFEFQTKLEDNSELYNLFKKYSFEHFPRISLHLIETNSTEESWQKYALKQYQNDALIAEKLLLKLHKTNTEKFISVAFTLINDPTSYNDEKNDTYLLDDLYYANAIWNEFLCPLLNYEEHHSLFIAVNLNLVNSKNDISYYLKVRDYLSEEQRQKFINVLWSTRHKVEVYIIENEFDKAKDVIYNCSTLATLKNLIEPFKDIDPEFAYNYVLSFVNEIIGSVRGRDLYSDIAALLNFAKTISVCGGRTYEFAKKICDENKRLTALKDEFRKAGLI